MPDYTPFQLDLARAHVRRTATPEQIAELERVRPDGTQAGNDPDEIRHWATMAQTDQAFGSAVFGNKYEGDPDEIDYERETLAAMRAPKPGDTSIAAFAESLYGGER